MSRDQPVYVVFFRTRHCRACLPLVDASAAVGMGKPVEVDFAQSERVEMSEMPNDIRELHNLVMGSES